MGSFILVVQTGVWLFFVGIFFFRGGGDGGGRVGVGGRGQGEGAYYLHLFY